MCEIRFEGVERVRNHEAKLCFIDIIVFKVFFFFFLPGCTALILLSGILESVWYTDTCMINTCIFSSENLVFGFIIIVDSKQEVKFEGNEEKKKEELGFKLQLPKAQLCSA